MPDEKLDIPKHRLGEQDYSEQLGKADTGRLGAVPMIVGTIRWSSSIGRPDSPVDQAFDMLVERLPVTPLEEVDPRSPHPFDCTVNFSDATDDGGPCVSFYVHGLPLLGFKNYPRSPHGFNMNGGYILTPSIKTIWCGPLGGRAFRTPLQFTPVKQGTPLTEEDSIATMHFTLAPS